MRLFRSKFTAFSFIILSLLSVFLIITKGVLFVFGLLLVTLVWALSHRLDIGWYILVFLSPMMNWFLDFSDYWYVFQDYPQLLSIHAPVVEFWTVLLICAYIISLVRDWLHGRDVHLFTPGIGFFTLFVISALVSLLNISPSFVSSGVWYLVRFILLFYVGYIVLGANIIKGKHVLHRSLLMFGLSGFLAMTMGIASLFTGAWKAVYGFPRVTPFAIGGWMPFGDQHIFLAEVLTTTIPIFVYFWYVQKDVLKRKWLGILVIVMVCTALATLSRAAWVTLVAQGFVFVMLLKKYISFDRIWKTARWFLLLLAPLVLYVSYFLLTNSIVQSSNAARWTLTDVSIFMFADHPVIGNGVGQFVPLLEDIKYFNVEFGAAVDAHGIVQKLLAEQGLIGLLAFALFVGWIVRRVYGRFQDSRYEEEARLVAFMGLFLVLSPFIFQLFNTQYYSSRMWVPIALALAQSIVYRRKREEDMMELNLKKKKPLSSKI